MIASLTVRVRMSARVVTTNGYRTWFQPFMNWRVRRGAIAGPSMGMVRSAMQLDHCVDLTAFGQIVQIVQLARRARVGSVRDPAAIDHQGVAVEVIRFG
jgi:hypothetical protein